MKGKTHDLNHDLTFSAHTIICVCHSIRSMFKVLGIYNFDSHMDLQFWTAWAVIRVSLILLKYSTVSHFFILGTNLISRILYHRVHSILCRLSIKRKWRFLTIMMIFLSSLKKSAIHERKIVHLGTVNTDRNERNSFEK